MQQSEQELKFDAEPHDRKKRGVHSAPWLLIGVLAVVAVSVSMLAKPRTDTYYRFITADHPIQVRSNRSGRWFYYGADAKTSAPQIAATARKELLSQGYIEDVTGKPWFRFVKGNREVIVCHHDEIAWNPVAPNAGVIHETPSTLPGRFLNPVVWVHQPGDDASGVLGFQIKKLVMRW